MSKKNRIRKLFNFIKNEKVILTIIILLAIIFRIFFNPVDIDDTPVTYRYAENIAGGKGFVYNEGERVIGTTTPLYTLLMAFFIKLGFNVFFASNSVGLISAVMSVVFVYLILKESGFGKAGLLAAFFLAVINDFVIYTMNGMETSFYIMLILAVIYFYIKEKMVITSMFLGLVALTRPDGLVLAAVVYAYYLITKRKIPWTSLAIFIAIILPWFIFAKLYSGSFLPISLMGKQIQGAVSTIPFVVRLLGFFYDRCYLILFPFFALGLITAYRFKKLYLLLLWAAAYILAYIIVGVETYAWYLIPLIPVFVIIASLGIDKVVEFIKLKSKKILPFIFIVGIIFLIIPTSILGMHHYINKVDPNWRSYITVSLWLKDNVPQDSSLMFGAIGYVGYYGGQRIIDTVFLVTELPEDIGRYGSIEEFTLNYTAIYEYYKPDYTIYRYTPGIDNYEKAKVPDWINKNYKQIKNFTFTRNYITEDFRFEIDFKDYWAIYERK